MTTNEPIDKPKPLAEFRDVTGTLTFDDHSLPITSTIQVNRDGTITITTQPIDLTKETVWIFQAVPGRERLAKWARLRATTKTGEQMESDHVVMTGRNDQSGPDGTSIALNGELRRITICYDNPPDTAADCRVHYWTVGMKGFGVQHTTSPLGTVRLAGQTDIKDYDHIAGFVQIQAHHEEHRPFASWSNECDDQISHLLLILSLAEGKLLEWSIRETSKNEHVITRTFYGPKHAGMPHDGIFHWLNLQPVLDLAVTNYTQELRDTTGIELAIRLLLAQPPHVELQLISAMTGLEHLISVYTKEHPISSPLDKKTFNEEIRPALEAAYDTITATREPSNEAERTHFAQRVRRVRDRIGNLNHTSFNDRLFRMLEDYRVPLVEINDRITKAVKARNDIIHTGHHDTPYEELTLHVAVLRELLKRIILTLLEYRGRYISFLHGQEFLEFPPTNITEPRS
jgi:hypothetical protein